MKRLLFGRSLLFLFLAFVGFSCTNEDREQTVPESEEEREITLEIAVPGVQSSTLRALQAKDENMIKSIDVLVFDENDTFDYYARSRKASGNIDGNATQSLDVILRVKTNQRLVIITNAKTEVSNLFASKSNWKGTAKKDMLSQLVAGLSNANGTWNTSYNYTALPMWGESSMINIVSSTISLGAPIPLLRMVAKVGVRLNKQQVPASLFKLKEVYVFNSLTSGQIVPDPDFITAGSTGQLRVTAPSLPPNAQTQRMAKYSGAEAFASPGEPDVAMEGTIYLFESAAPSDRDQATGLVVGGIYQNDAKITYYRVDFMNNDQSFLDILRNFHYNINVTGVEGPGYDTPEEAWENMSVKMDVDIIITWEKENGGMEIVVFDGQHYLRVNQDSIVFFKDECLTPDPENALELETNYPSGWRIESITSLTTGQGTGWLTITDHAGRTDLDARGDGNFRSECTFTYSENRTGKDRAIEIIVVAGNLRFPITVTQNTLEKPTIRIYREYPGPIDQPNDSYLIANDTITIMHNPADVFYVERKVVVAWKPEKHDVIVYEEYLPHFHYLPMQTVQIQRSIKWELMYPHYGFCANTLYVRPHQFAEDSSGNYPPGIYATSLVFLVSNGGQTIEKRLVIRYVVPNN